MATVQSRGDIVVNYSDFTGVSTNIAEYITDFQKQMASFPFRFQGNGLRDAFMTKYIRGETGSWDRYIGHNNVRKKKATDDWQFNAGGTSQKRIAKGVDWFSLDFKIKKGELNLSQASETPQDIMSRFKEGYEIAGMNNFFDEVNQAKFRSTTTPQEDQYCTVIPSNMKFGRADSQEPRVVEGAAVGWNTQKIGAVNIALERSRIGSSMAMFICVAAIDSMEGLMIDPQPINYDYMASVARIAGKKTGDFFDDEVLSVGQRRWRWIKFPDQIPGDLGEYQGVPCFEKQVNSVNTTLYREFVCHPAMGHFIRPADEPTMEIDAFYDKNSFETRFRLRFAESFLVLNPPGVGVVENKANVSTLTINPQ